MTSALIIGSGAAAAGAALALSHRENLKLTVIDIGLRLEADREQLVAALASSSPGDWDEHTVELISKQPVVPRIPVSPRSAYSARTIHSEMWASSVALLQLTVRTLL